MSAWAATGRSPDNNKLATASVDKTARISQKLYVTHALQFEIVYVTHALQFEIVGIGPLLLSKVSA
eukprot:2427132-Rhodomonas_salina.1